MHLYLEENYDWGAVGATAINDWTHGQVSSMSEYVRVALNGSIIGAMSGAEACIPTKGLGIMGKYAAEFCIGAGESAFEQQLWEIRDIIQSCYFY